MMLTFLGFNFIFNQAPHVWMDIGLMFVYYGLYFGVLGRDISEICADKMAANIGVCQKLSGNFNKQRNNEFLVRSFSVLHTTWNTESQSRAKCLRRLWQWFTSQWKRERSYWRYIQIVLPSCVPWVLYTRLVHHWKETNLPVLQRESRFETIVQQSVSESKMILSMNVWRINFFLFSFCQMGTTTCSLRSTSWLDPMVGRMAATYSSSCSRNQLVTRTWMIRRCLKIIFHIFSEI